MKKLFVLLMLVFVSCKSEPRKGTTIVSDIVNDAGAAGECSYEAEAVFEDFICEEPVIQQYYVVDAPKEMCYEDGRGL
jgi:hypothetical protein